MKMLLIVLGPYIIIITLGVVLETQFLQRSGRVFFALCRIPFRIVRKTAVPCQCRSCVRT